MPRAHLLLCTIRRPDGTVIHQTTDASRALSLWRDAPDGTELICTVGVARGWRAACIYAARAWTRAIAPMLAAAALGYIAAPGGGSNSALAGIALAIVVHRLTRAAHDLA